MGCVCERRPGPNDIAPKHNSRGRGGRISRAKRRMNELGPSRKSQALKETLEGSTVSIGINESRFPLLRLCRYLYEESDPLATTSPQGTGTRNARRLTKFLLALNDTSQELSKALMRGSGVQARPARELGGREPPSASIRAG